MIVLALAAVFLTLAAGVLAVRLRNPATWAMALGAALAWAGPLMSHWLPRQTVDPHQGVAGDGGVAMGRMVQVSHPAARWIGAGGVLLYSGGLLVFALSARRSDP